MQRCFRFEEAPIYGRISADSNESAMTIESQMSAGKLFEISFPLTFGFRDGV